MKRFAYNVLRRTAELLLLSMVLSAIVTGLNVAGILRTHLSTLLALIAGATFFIIINIRLSRNSYFDLRNVPKYRLVNGSAFLLYNLILMFVYKIGGNIIFTWLFSITKFASYINFNITAPLAVAFFDFILIISMLIAPAGMDFLLMYHENQAEDI